MTEIFLGSLASFGWAPNRLDSFGRHAPGLSPNAFDVDIQDVANGVEGRHLLARLLSQLPPRVPLLFLEQPDVGFVGEGSMGQAPRVLVQDPIVHGSPYDIQKEGTYLRAIEYFWGDESRQFLDVFIEKSLGIPDAREWFWRSDIFEAFRWGPFRESKDLRTRSAHANFSYDRGRKEVRDCAAQRL